MVSRTSPNFVAIAILTRIVSLGFALATRNDARISWKPCGNATIPRECGTFQVPLDYADLTVGTASLAVAKLNATVSPRLGTIFVNPGGPGGSGVQWVLSDVMSLILNGTGGRFDIVSWDPRGVGNTEDWVRCFDSGTAERSFWNGSLRGTDLAIRNDFTDPAAREEFYSHIDEVDSTLIKFGKQCNSQTKGMLKYVGTAATVRDMVALHDNLEGNKPINYWGLSYGTIIGNYFVNTFPDRVGRVIIDGIVNPWDWATEQPKIVYGLANFSDATFDAFASSCAAAGPFKCAIAQEESTLESIRKWVFSLIELAYDNTKASGGTFITSGQLRGLLWVGMYEPRKWPGLAQDLAQIAAALSNSSNSSSTVKSRILSPRTQSIPFIRRDNTSSFDPATSYAFQAITCVDAIDAGNSTTRQGFKAVVELTDNHTRMFGPFIGWNAPVLYCQHWPVRAVERFTGPFNHTLRNRIMVIGNSVDPITPFGNAKAVAEALGSSAVLLKHNGYGHASIYMHSSCTVAATSKYFITGELPPKGTVCEVSKIRLYALYIH
ncbi:hydrolase, putative [Rhizoctonia solani AG-3 Rhs1AP]|uniref:Hydrolase, putative n=2 Tax=Rhizoctonia solani AG-3 TaxID=1086053 RepID=X8IZ89_9AGAM|nr:hydrolase, putative [Rhizoctonia solani AG-3 Rhs1AP]KEP47152.1 putative hydrolase [Rhizoctonia solani 123E]